MNSKKRRAYEQRNREINHASFSPLVLSATGGLAHFLQETCLHAPLQMGPNLYSSTLYVGYDAV